MVKILLKLVVFILPILIIFICGLFYLPTTIESNNMLYVSIEKRNRLKNIESPKMVFIGGSSMAFGLDSKVVEEKLNYPVVNMGLHAGIGLRYMLLEVAPYLKKGDILIVATEYEHFNNAGFYGGDILPILLFDIHKDYDKLDFINTIYLFPEIAHYNLKKIRTFLSDKNNKQTTNIKDNESKIYAKTSFNTYGDMIAHWTAEIPQKNISEQNNMITQETSNYNVSYNVINFLSDFEKEMKQRGIKVFFFPPPYKETLFKESQEYIKEITIKLERKNIAYSTPPKRYVFSDSLFFDTSYHLNKKGVDKRTEYLIEDLANKLK